MGKEKLFPHAGNQIQEIPEKICRFSLKLSLIFLIFVIKYDFMLALMHLKQYFVDVIILVRGLTHLDNFSSSSNCKQN